MTEASGKVRTSLPSSAPRFVNKETEYECCTPGCTNRSTRVYCQKCRPDEEKNPHPLGHTGSTWNGREIKPMPAKFPRRCEYCGATFMAKTNRAKYCPKPKDCGPKAAQQRIREAKAAA